MNQRGLPKVVPEPHGNRLTDRTADRPEDTDELPCISLTDDSYMQLEMLGTGAYSRPDVFMTRDDFDAVIERSRLVDGTPWSLPVVLPSDGDVSEEKHALIHDGAVVGAVDVEQTCGYDDERAGRRRDSEKTECGLHSTEGGG